MTTQPTFAERLRFWRERAGLTQFEIAKRLGLDPSSVTAWAKGDNHPTLENVLKLVHELGVDMSTFFGPLEDKPTTDDEVTTPGAG